MTVETITDLFEAFTVLSFGHSRRFSSGNHTRQWRQRKAEARV